MTRVPVRTPAGTSARAEFPPPHVLLRHADLLPFPRQRGRADSLHQCSAPSPRRRPARSSPVEVRRLRHAGGDRFGPQRPENASPLRLVGEVDPLVWVEAVVEELLLAGRPADEHPVAAFANRSMPAACCSRPSPPARTRAADEVPSRSSPSVRIDAPVAPAMVGAKIDVQRRAGRRRRPPPRARPSASTSGMFVAAR